MLLLLFAAAVLLCVMSVSLCHSLFRRSNVRYFSGGFSRIGMSSSICSVVAES